MSQSPAPRLLELIPHRPPMLLLSKVVSVSNNSAKALVTISSESPFVLPGKGVPASVSLEYMGQTAALIGGYQLEQGVIGPHLGFLLGARQLTPHRAYFPVGMTLAVEVSEGTVVNQELANFECKIFDQHNAELVCEGTLSVLRKLSAELNNE